MYFLPVIVIVVLYLVLTAVPAFVIMILLGVLASLTGWSVAIGFLACYVISLILGLFFNN